VKFSGRAAVVAIAIFAFIAVFTLAPAHRALAIQIYAFGICGLVLLWLLGRTSAWSPGESDFDRARVVEPPKQEPLPELARVEREVTMGVGTAFDLHYRLRPRVREIAASRLADRRGIDLERRPEAAREALDEPVWELVRPDRVAPRNHHGPGLGLPGLRAVLEGLDRI
jgi:hypothetical protein